MRTPAEKYRKANWHCYKLGELLGAVELEGLLSSASDCKDADRSLRSAADWLQLAAELTEVRLDTYEFSPGWFMCGSAADFDDARAKFQEQLVVRIVRFNFAWNAFEIVCNALELEPHPKGRRGTNSNPKAATWCIKRHSVDAKDFRGYAHLLEHALTWLKNHPDLSHIQIPQDWDSAYISEAGYGLELCRQLRNTLAHGAATIPLPGGWRWDESLSDDEWLAFPVVALKLLLISVQMILACHLTGAIAEEESPLYDLCGNDFIGYLRNVHLEPDSE